MTGPGQLIKDTRISKNLTIENVSTTLRIHKNLITAIENDQVEKFVSRAYYQGYMKQYLKFLQLDYVVSQDNIIETDEELAINIPKSDKFNPSYVFALIALTIAVIIYNLCSGYFAQ